MSYAELLKRLCMHWRETESCKCNVSKSLYAAVEWGGSRATRVNHLYTHIGSIRSPTFEQIPMKDTFSLEGV